MRPSGAKSKKIHLSVLMTYGQVPVIMSIFQIALKFILKNIDLALQ